MIRRLRGWLAMAAALVAGLSPALCWAQVKHLPSVIPRMRSGHPMPAYLLGGILFVGVAVIAFRKSKRKAPHE